MICKLCQRKIIKESEDYYEIIGYHLGKESGPHLFYHRICFLNKIKEKSDMNNLMDMTRNLGLRADKLLTEAGV